jgi:hypothetical protein
MTAIQERYSTARNATNLKMKTETNFAPVDILTAVGMASDASREAIMLWEVTFQGKTSAKLACVEMLSKKLAAQMIKNRWKGSPSRIASQVLAWHLHGTCQPCGGRRYQHIQETPSLSDKLCLSCNGTGKMRLPREDAYSWLQDYTEKLISQAGGKVMQKLAISMEL